MSTRYVKPERIWLKTHSDLGEKWVQARIAEDPSILNLGELVLRDQERSQPRAGRLDLLLQDPESKRRYEVELQLGATDESHIIRTIEYWDIERKRYPQYDHCAVLIAEDVTSRFLNVISLFNGSVPVIAIQMQALRIDDQVALVFTTVLDELTRGLVDEDEDAEATPTDRNYWEARASRATVSLADDLLQLAREFEPTVELKYNKFYIGLSRGGQPFNFVQFRPRKSRINVDLKIPQSPEVDSLIEAAGLEALEYSKNWNQYRIALAEDDLIGKKDALRELIRLAYVQRTS